MKLLKLSWKNFQSYGNKIQEIDLSDQNGTLNLIVGKNGTGKTTIQDTLSFNWYGKVGGKKTKKDLPNRFNKNLVTTTHCLSPTGSDVTIHRNVAPDSFTGTGFESDVAGVANVQDILETHYLKMPFYLFNNLISLSINDFKSFLNMSAADKRMIIDKIFGFSILNRMLEIHRSNTLNIKKSIEKYDNEIGFIKNTILENERKIEQIKEKSDKDNSHLITILDEEINGILENIEKYNDEINKLNEKYTLRNEEKSKITSQIHEINALIRSYDEKINLYKQQKCPTCGSDLHTDEHENIYKQYVKDRESTLAVKNENLTILEDLNDKLSKIIAFLEQRKTYVSNLKSQKQDCDYKKKEITNGTILKEKIDSLSELLETHNSNVKKVLLKKSEQESELAFSKIVEVALNEKGIKSTALSSIVPNLNQNITAMLKMLGIDYTVHFDGEFNATVIHLGSEINTSSLSVGEMKKLDFAILISIIKLIKLKFPTLNVLFLDEIFASLDSDSVSQVIQILSKTAKDIEMNIFVINHAQLDHTEFDYVINVQKTNGFSNIEVHKVT